MLEWAYSVHPQQTQEETPMADSTLRAWLRTHLDNTELATEAPKAFDLGLVAGTLGALLALPAFAATPLGIIMAGLAINRVSAYIDRLRPPDLSYSQRKAILNEGIAANDPAVHELVAATLVEVAPTIGELLPPANQIELVRAIGAGMQHIGGPAAAIAPRYTAALINPNTDWPALQTRLHETITSVRQTMEASDGGVLSGGKQRTEGASGAVEQNMVAKGPGSRIENSEQITIGTRHPPKDSK